MVGDENSKSPLWVLVALLCVGAAVLLVQIFTADGFDDGESMKAFMSAIVLAFVSLSIGAGSNLASRQPGIALFGYMTIMVGGLALLLSANLIWSDEGLMGEVTTLDKWAFYTLIATIALGVASTVITGHDDGDADSVKLVRGMTVFALFALCVTAIDEVRVSGQQVDSDLLGGLSVFFLLGMLLLPLLRTLTAEHGG